MIAISSLILSVCIGLFLIAKIIAEFIKLEIFPIVPRDKYLSAISERDKRIDDLLDEVAELKTQVKVKESKRTF